MAGLTLLVLVILWKVFRKPAEDLRAARQVLERFTLKNRKAEPPVPPADDWPEGAARSFTFRPPTGE